MILADWRCGWCGGHLDVEDIVHLDVEDILQGVELHRVYVCGMCGREYREQDGTLVPLVQRRDEGEPEKPHKPRTRHTAGWRERTG